MAKPIEELERIADELCAQLERHERLMIAGRLLDANQQEDAHSQSAASAFQPETKQKSKKQGKQKAPQGLSQAEQAQLDAWLQQIGRSHKDQTNEWGSTPLMRAAYNNNAAMLALILKAGANPSLSNQYGYTALMIAAFRNSAQMTQSLLDYGADVNMECHGCTAIQATEHAEVRRLLVQHGSIDRPYDRGFVACSLFTNAPSSLSIGRMIGGL